MKYVFMDSPVGPLTVVSGPEGLEAIVFGRRAPDGAEPDVQANAAAVSQLNEYFSGQRRVFDLKLAAKGTPFQQSVWRQLVGIPFGETRSYGQIARALGKPGAARAVGMANHENPIPIIIPCHRVVGANGSLTGYAGGLDMKACLLALEADRLTKEQTATSHTRGGFTELAAAL
jgi:methylated-DNA-[protein]-cysteine S-methyltransferase